MRYVDQIGKRRQEYAFTQIFLPAFANVLYDCRSCEAAEQFVSSVGGKIPFDPNIIINTVCTSANDSITAESNFDKYLLRLICNRRTGTKRRIRYAQCCDKGK